MSAPSPVRRFRKRPVAVDAMRWDGSAGEATTVIDWILANGGTARYHDEPPALSINTLEGTMTAPPGSWVIRGVAGEFYRCEPGIFARTYDPADGLEGKTPGQAVYEAHQAFMIRCFPGIAPIGREELSPEAQAQWEGIARTGIAAYIEANGRDPVDAVSVIAEVIVPELAALRDRMRSAADRWERHAGEQKRLAEQALSDPVPERRNVVREGHLGKADVYRALAAEAIDMLGEPS